MNIESVLAILANFVAILVAVKNDTPNIFLFKNTFF